MEKELYSVDEVAKILSLHTRTIRRYIKENKLKASKVGGIWRIPKSEINRFQGNEEFIQQNEVKTNNEVLKFLNKENDSSKGKIQSCLINDCFVESSDEAQIICSDLLKYINNLENPEFEVKFQYVFNKIELRARFIIWGPSKNLAEMLNILSKFS